MADFFDKMKDSFNKGMATVSTSSKTMIEKNKINSNIKNLENEKSRIATVIGNKVYAYCLEHAEGDIPRAEVAELCNEIASYNEQILALRKRIEELDAELEQVKSGGAPAANAPVQCPCGHVNAPGAKFCGKCGTKLV